MSSHGLNEARTIRASLKHPLIAADEHWAEFAPNMREEFRKIGGDTAVEALAMASARIPASLSMSVAERRRRRIGQEAFWFLPTKNTLDRATAMMPRLLYERLDDLGLDFCVVYPTAGLGYYRLPPDKLRRALCRAYNVFTMDQFRPYGDRIIPAAIIPMYTPEEALEELEFASRQLGFKVVMMGSLIRRPIPALPGAELRVPGGRRGLGVHAVRRSHRALGEAEAGCPREHEPVAARPRGPAGVRREIREAQRAGGGAPRRRPGRQRRRHRRRGESRRLLALPDHAQARFPRPLRQALLLRLRGRRPDQRVGLQPQGESGRRAAQRVLQLGHRPL